VGAGPVDSVSGRTALGGADGGAARALERLIDVVAVQRTARLEATLYDYGDLAGRSKETIEAEVWRRRTNSAAVMDDFTLPRLDRAGSVRLADLRGQVVLVNFWYPG
jgi:hypothetical protein